MRSSYEENNLGEVFQTLIKCFRYPNAVELGVLDGYSAEHIARGLKANKERWGINAKLKCYDLWDLYAFKHGNLAEVESRIRKDGLEEFVELYKGDAFFVNNLFQDRSIHFLHVDISNTGDVLRKIMELWDRKIYQGGMIVIEGGSTQRDQVEWMVKYNMAPIKAELETNAIIKANYIYGTYEQFPSLTVLYKKWENL